MLSDARRVGECLIKPESGSAASNTLNFIGRPTQPLDLLPADSLLKQLLSFALALDIMFRLCCIAESIKAMQLCRLYDSWLQEARTQLLQAFAGNTLLCVGWAFQNHGHECWRCLVSLPLRAMSRDTNKGFTMERRVSCLDGTNNLCDGVCLLGQ